MIGKGIASRSSSLKLTVVSGIIKQLGTPVSRQVRAYSRENGSLLESTNSDENGQYKMYLPYGLAYTIVSIDSNKKFNAVIQDNVVPK
ncbi:hypothetical protein [Acinetobacter sp. NIPH 298]|uniref:hypothetical protein n=1 Tax=Acinetobacter sp. NIPH 298 TaxID=1217692 RepID=UPI0002CF1D16|nr:hypothetical protein [Acinetobacter sp. NIPH 298]ENW95793.1 hypothetical protein F903_01555 [Acinetobacter sp. NIPH 298]